MASPPSNSTPPASDSSAPPPKDSLSPPPSDASSPPPKDFLPPPSTDASPPPSKDSPSPPPPDASPPPPNSSLPPPIESPPPSPPNASPHPPASSSPPPSPPTPSPPPADNNSPPSVVSSPSPPSQSTSPVIPSNPGVLPPPAPKEGTIQSPPGNGSSQMAPKSSNGGSSSQSTPVIQNDDISIDRPVVIGVVAGIGLFFILILACALFCFCRRKKNKRPGRYDAEGGKDYYKNKGSAPPRWRPRGKNDKIPPPLGLVPPPGNAGWQHHGPLTPSEEMGSSNYSPNGANLLPPPSASLGFNNSTFTYEELAAATGGFSQSNILGQGGFGYVYKGILPNGKEVAIKQLKAGSGQGEREFHAEVEIISRVHHRHLVSLVGYCIADAQRLLVYQFVPNNTLEYHLHGEGVPTMDWPTRLKIAIGSAKGLSYLHEDCHPRIIHRDIKTANILLDNNFEAMVADFGLAKLSPDTHTHVSTRIMGTFGYLAPEYASSGKLTDKSDVFSYGVVLLELITGRKPVDHTNRMDEGLVEWARPRLAQILAEENYEDLVDPKLEGNYNKIELNRMITCAAASVRHSGKKRPRMSQIVHALEGDMISFDDISEAARAGQSSMFSSSGSEVEVRSLSSKMRQFNKLALASEEFTGEYSGMSVTSEYGLNPSDSSSSSSGEILPDATPEPRLTDIKAV